MPCRTVLCSRGNISSLPARSSIAQLRAIRPVRRLDQHGGEEGIVQGKQPARCVNRVEFRQRVRSFREALEIFFHRLSGTFGADGLEQALFDAK